MADTFKYSYRSDETKTVSLAVYNVGYERCHSLHSWGSGVRDHYLIHHIISGEGNYRTPYGSYHLKAGDTFIIYPFTEVTYTADNKNPWEYYWVGFSGGDAEIIISQTDFTRESPVMSADFGDELKNRLLDIYVSHGQTNSSAVKMTGQLYIALSLIMEKSCENAIRGNLLDEYTAKAQMYIAYNYSRPISVEDIAFAVGVSRSTLFRAFISTQSKSPVEYLTDFRITQACKLLKETTLTVTAVANSVGYEDNLYFSRAFKKKMGVSPREYKALNNVKSQHSI